MGFETEFSALGVKVSGVEVLGTLQGRAAQITSEAYQVTKRIVYTTGPIEDTVIFTTIPLDQYTYEVTSHPDPELIGSKVVISLPREPIEVQVEREQEGEGAEDRSASPEKRERPGQEVHHRAEQRDSDRDGGRHRRQHIERTRRHGRSV